MRASSFSWSCASAAWPRVLFVALLLLLAPAARAQDDGGPGADREWRFIQKLEQDGMADLAVRQLEKFAAQFPTDPRAAGALLRAGDGWRALGQNLAAQRAYESLLERYPSAEMASSAALRRADLLVEAESFEAAAEAYRSLLSSYPASDEVEPAQLGLGESLMALQRNEDAQRLLQRLIAGRASSPIAARAQFDLGLLAHRAADDSLAIARFESIHRLYPDELIGGFGLLRAADLLVEREAPAAARERYEKVLSVSSEPLVRARARLGLARLLEEDDPRAAAKQFAKVREDGGTDEQLHTALLGEARTSLRADRRDDARKASQLYLDRFSESAQADRARLYLARADLGDGKEGAEERLRALGDASDAQVGYEALSVLARHQEGAKRLEEALDSWRRAERAAPSADLRAEALLQQATLASRLQRPALAADTARQARATAQDARLQAQALLLAARSSADAGHRAEAIALGERLAQEHPLRSEATEVRGLLRTLRRQAERDPDAAAEALAALAEQPFESASARSLEVGLLVRDEWGATEASLAHFERAATRAENPAQRSHAQYERGVALQTLALERGLSGRTDPAREALREARDAYADAAAEGGASRSAAAARARLIGLDLAEAARPETPWMFDADSMPLLGAAGAAESVDLRSSRLDATRERLVHAIERSEDRDESAWLVWRWAELSDADPAERIARVQAALQRKPSEARQLSLRYALGQLYLLQDEGAAAARELGAVVEKAPTGELGMAARYGLAEAQRSEKRWTQAAQLYVEYASAYPQTQRGERSLLLAGDCELFAGRNDEATKLYRDLLERYPNSVYEDDTLYRLGTALQRSGRSDAAREPFLRLAQWTQQSEYRGRGLARLADLELAAGRDSSAVAALSRLVEVEPERAREEKAPRRLAQIELRRGRPAEAVRWLERASQDRGEEESGPDPELLSLRVSAAAAAGRLKEAASDLEQLSLTFPDEGERIAEARLDLADAQLEAGRTQPAVESYQVAATETVEPTLRARAAYGEGLALAKAGDFDAAAARWESARRLSARSEWAAQAEFKLGGLAASRGDAPRAQAAYASLVQNFPSHELAPDALRGEARALREMGRFDRALELYHRLLEDYPDAPGTEEVLGNIAYCHHEMGQYEVAIAAYERVLPYLDEEGQGYAQFWIADSLDQLGRHEEAAAAFLRIPYLYPSVGQLPVTAQLKAAESYEKMGQQDAASKLYEKVLAAHGAGSQWGAEAQRRLQRIAGTGDGGS